MSLFNGPNIFEELDTDVLENYVGYGGNSDVSTGPRDGALSVNPTAGGGVAAPLGTVIKRYLPGFVSLWQKTGVANTAWTQIAAVASTPSLVVGVDPGAGGAIAVDRSYAIVLVEAAGGGPHIRTLAAPTFLGQQMVFWADAGTITGAGAAQINVAGTIEATGLMNVRFNVFPGATPAAGINAPAPATQFTANVADGARAITERFLKLEAIQKGGMGWHVIQADGVAFIV
jgi:hypothetical protein